MWAAHRQLGKKCSPFLWYVVKRKKLFALALKDIAVWFPVQLFFFSLLRTHFIPFLLFSLFFDKTNSEPFFFLFFFSFIRSPFIFFLPQFERFSKRFDESGFGDIKVLERDKKWLVLICYSHYLSSEKQQDKTPIEYGFTDLSFRNELVDWCLKTPDFK